MRKITLLLCGLALSVLAYAQSTRTGTVRDEKGEPVPFATVTVVGTKTATKADANGNFAIKATDGAQLRITATGHQEQVLTVSGNAVNATLNTTQAQLTEVVVTTALGVRKQKKELGYSTTQVSARELTTGRAPNVGSALSGKVAGLSIQQPNSGVTNDVRINLRGNRSLTGNNQPILVIDGSIVSINYLNQINPNDIDNINVLKGAASTALYGNEASNGAIVITTKRGSRTAATITASSTVTFESISLMPKLQDQFGSYGGEGLDAQGRSTYIPYENQSYGPRYDGHMVPVGDPVRIFNPDGTFRDSVWMVPYSAIKNGKRDFFNTGVTAQHNVAFSSGDASGGQFYLSAENLTRTGTVPDDKSTRNSFRINASKEIHRVTVGANINFIRSTYDVVGPDVNQDRSVYWSVLNAPAHIDLKSLSDIVNNPFATPSGYFNAYYGNPWWTIKNSRQMDTRDNIIGNARLEYRPLDWLSASYTLNYNAYFDQYTYHRNSIAYASWAKSFAESGFDIYPASGGYKTSNYPGVTQTGYRERYNYARLQGDFLLNLHHDFSKFTTQLLLGQSTYQITTDQNDQGYDPTTGAVNSYSDITVWGPAYAIGAPLSYHYESKRRTIGAFADLTVGFNNWAFIHGSLRNDWDSRLEKSNRSFLYPAADASVIFTDAIPALKNNQILSSGKIRVSYAKVGQVNVDPYSTRDIYTAPAGVGFPYANVSGFAVGATFNNLNIKPEFTAEKEIGLELAWLKNRLLTDFAVFQQNTTNQTLRLGISTATGRGNAYLNIGEVQNRGLEADIKGTIIRSRDLNWSVGVNYSYIENKVLSIAPGVTTQQLTSSGLGGGVYAVVGKAYPYLQTTDWDRDPQGRIIVDASTGLPTRNATPVPFGTTQPPHRLGVNTQLTYRNFTLAAVAEFRGGAVILNNIGTDLDFTGVSANTTKFNREKFVIPNSSYYDGSKYVANTSIVTNTDAWNFFGNIYNQVGSNYVTSADFWKLREISIGYNLPASWLSKTRVIKGANLALVGRDLFIWTVKENIWTDPEFSNTTGNGIGITTNTQTPSTRKYGVSLNLTF